MLREEIHTDNDLVDAVKEALERKGILSQIKAQIRAEVFHSLEDKTVSLPEKPPDVFIATELVKELLITLKLNNTLSVFCEEVGQPGEMGIDREFIGGEVGLNTIGTNTNIPLLILIIQYLKKNKFDCLDNNKDVSLAVEADSVIDN